ncbi:hydrogenase small subunit [Sulfurovum sp. zt1-1]|uniref:Hydrogenase small subunit n=1 Tax=Sulfurovum zhangzhouensis TaxID=3019067 RepID=A0ABT7QX63_9BACT|nr:hydrogenase small subunit [Sulfurovum zhangzhouensis]MDM5271134.1 hydrogenase small subunit [Sulfurovum zhangzhouensis]
MNSYDSLLKQAEMQLESLAKLSSVKEEPLEVILDKHGINRRDFLKWAASITAMLALPAQFTPLVADAVKLADRLPLVWIHLAECTGCSESLIRTDSPTIDSLIFDYVSLEYHETLMAAAGWQAEENLENAIKNYAGRYILLVEGGVPTAMNGQYLTVGAHARTGLELIHHAASSAAAIFSIGTCASFGGIQAAAPNPTGAKGVDKVISNPVINIPGCPPSSKNIVGTLVYFILFGTLPAIDVYSRPKWAYGQRIHDKCERRSHFDAGEFVESFGDEGAKEGWCLYKQGCKGPYTFNNCSVERFNQHTNWPIGAGHGCMGCSEPDFWDAMGPLEKPIDAHLVMGLNATVDQIGTTLLTATAIGIGAHAVASLFASKSKEEDDE